MNSLVAARRRLELLAQYVLDERGVVEEEAAAKEREGLAHLIQRQHQLLVRCRGVGEGDGGRGGEGSTSPNVSTSCW
jgi:hypothetical protein